MSTQEVRNAQRRRYHSSYMRAERKSMRELQGRHAAEYDEIFKRRLREERLSAADPDAGDADRPG